MSAPLHYLATAPFEAARQVAILPAGPRSRRLHGHSFLARVRAALPSGWAPFPGGESGALADAVLVMLALVGFGGYKVSQFYAELDGQKTLGPTQTITVPEGFSSR